MNNRKFRRIVIIVFVIIALVSFLGFLDSGLPIGDSFFAALIVVGLIFSVLSGEKGSSGSSNGYFEAHLYNTDEATGEQIAQLRNLNEKLGNNPNTSSGELYSHLYGCSDAKGEIIGQLTMINETLAKRQEEAAETAKNNQQQEPGTNYHKF